MGPAEGVCEDDVDSGLAADLDLAGVQSHVPPDDPCTGVVDGWSLRDPVG